jgi:hypothetical protein
VAPRNGLGFDPQVGLGAAPHEEGSILGKVEEGGGVPLHDEEVGPTRAGARALRPQAQGLVPEIPTRLAVLDNPHAANLAHPRARVTRSPSAAPP